MYLQVLPPKNTTGNTQEKLDCKLKLVNMQVNSERIFTWSS